MANKGGKNMSTSIDSQVCPEQKPHRCAEVNNALRPFCTLWICILYEYVMYLIILQFTNSHVHWDDVQMDICRRRQFLSAVMATKCIRLYCALAISHGNISPNNSRKTPIACPLGRGMGVFWEFEVQSKFYIRSSYTGYNIVLYYTAIYRESTVWASNLIVS